MIQQQTFLNVSDNSGARTVKCIKVLGGFRRKFAKLGDIIVVSVQDVKDLTTNIKKGEIFKALIIRTKKKIKNRDGSTFCLFENSVCLIDKRNKRTITPKASRITGIVPTELTEKYSDFTKISGNTF